MKHTLLVIDDDDASRRLIERIFGAEGFHVLLAPDGPAGFACATTAHPDVVLLDLHLPGPDGMDVLERLRAAIPDVPVLMLTGSQDIKHAVRATKLGAFDYLTKPVDRAEIVLAVRRALETRMLRQQVHELRTRVDRSAGDSLARQLGTSAHVARVAEQVALVAGSNFTVLVLGETGTGKELVAQAIHRDSERRQRAFVALDCGAIPEALLESELFGHEKGAFTGADRRRAGRFRLADGGTCFLDEVGNLPLNLQAKLLRVLESGQLQPVGAERTSPMDVRFVAATNNDLQQRAGDGLFRADLYFRLAQYAIHLPPLRDRPEDIDFLAQRFVGEASIDLRRPIQAITPDALDVLRAHRWPGNVRELRNVVRQAVLQADGLVIRADALRALLRIGDASGPLATGTPHEARSLRAIAAQAGEAAERRAIADALQTAAGNKSRAAKALRTDFKTLHVKMKHLGLRAGDFKR
ncbi:MAG: sigma-54 dependent transcriptional regulator [Acidobacteriota bacterium]